MDSFLPVGVLHFNLPAAAIQANSQWRQPTCQSRMLGCSTSGWVRVSSTYLPRQYHSVRRISWKRLHTSDASSSKARVGTHEKIRSKISKGRSKRCTVIAGYYWIAAKYDLFLCTSAISIYRTPRLFNSDVIGNFSSNTTMKF